MLRLQIALDLLDLDHALRVAEQAAPWIDIMEAGTPLIKSVGLGAIRELRRRFPGKVVLADMKTADVGDLEVQMAADSGADLVSVLACAPEETIAAAQRTAEARGVRLVADLIGVVDLPTRLRLLEDIGVAFAEVHCGIDEQRAGKDPFATLRRVGEATGLRLAVAGGLSPDNLARLPALANLEVVVVGGAITKASDPALVARGVAALIGSEG